MAGGSVKLSIYSTFKDDGTKQAERAVKRFAQKFGELDAATGTMRLDEATESLVRQSVAADQAAAKWAGYASSLQAAGEKITKYVSAPAAAAVTACAKLASDYEDSFAKVKTIMDKQAVPVETLQQDILDLSTATGKAATELSDATYQALSASVETSKVAGFVEDAANLSKAGFTETATAVDTLTTVINAYGYSADDAQMISERLVQTQNKGKTTVDELASSMGNVIPTAAAYNVNLDNLCSAYVTLTKQGINTANATTAINGMLTELADGGSDVAAILKDQTGKSFGELMADGMDLGQVIQLLSESVDGDSEAFANLWGNVRASKGALAIANAGADAFAEAMSDMGESAGLVSEALEDLVTPSSRANKAINAVKNTGIELGQEFLGALAPGLERAAELAQGAYDAFSGLSEGEKQSVAQALAIAAAAGPAVLGLSKMAGGVSSALSAYGTLTASLAKISSGAEGAFVTLGKLGPVAKGPAAAAAVVLGVALAACAKGIVDTKQRMDDLSDSTKLLASATTAGAPSLEAAAGASESHAAALVHERTAVEDVTRAQAELAREIEKRNSSAQSDINALERAKDTIHRYANQTNLTAQEQGQLRAAVELVNQECGTQYSVVDAANGKLADEEGQIVKNCDAIDDYIAKKQEQVRVEALTRDLSDLTSQREDDLAALATAQRDYNQAVSDLRQAEEAGVTGEVWQVYADKVATSEQALAEARGNLSACDKAIEEIEKRLGSATKAAEGGKQSISDLARNTQELYATMSADIFGSFCDQLEDTGIKTKQFKSLSTDQLMALSAAYDGNIESIERALDDMGVKVPAKAGQAASGAAKAVEKAGPEAVSAAQRVTSSTLAVWDQLASKSSAPGAKATSALAAGMSSKSGEVAGAAASTSATAQGMVPSGSYGWGQGLVSNFASGIASKIEEVRAASNRVAAAASTPIRHSVPKEGPLHNHGLGEAGWGEETVGNYARGMLAATGYVRTAALAAAAAAAGGLQGQAAPAARAGAVAIGAQAMPQSAFADLLAAKLAAQIASALGDRPSTVNYWGGIQYTDGTAIGDMLTELAHAVEVEEGC